MARIGSTKFASVDGGFCCDQYTIAAPAHNVVIWELLYSYSATTQKNTIRLAVMSGAANVGTATVLGSYSITSQTLGYPAGTWIDYTQLAKTDKWLYMTGNVFNGAGAYQGSTVSRYDLAAMSVGGTISIQAYNPVGGSPRCSNIVSGTRMHIAHHNSTTSIKLATWDDVGGGPTSVERTIPTWYAGMTPQPGPDGKDFLARSDNRILTGYQNSRELAFYWNSNLGGSFTRPFVRGVVFDLALNYKRDDNIAASANAWGYPATAVNIAGHVGYVISYGGGAFFPGANIFLRDNVNCFPENAVAASGNAGPDSGLGDYQQVQVHPNLMTFVAACIAQVGGTTNAFSEPRNVHFGRTTTIPTLFDLSVNSVVPSGASVTVNVADNFCEANGTTPFTRTYNSGSGVTLTAPATLGSRAFYRWRLDGVDQGLGVTALGVSMTAAHTASAVYGVFTTPVATAFGTPCLGAGGLPTLTIAAPILIGTNFQHKLTNGPVNKPAYLALGASRTSWPPLTLPFVLPGTTCSVYTDTLITLGTVVPAGGIVFWNLAMPNDVTLLGGKLYTQDINIDIGANSWNLTLSNALELTIGGWNLL